MRRAVLALRKVGFAMFVAFAPTTLPPWRADPGRRVAIVLAVGAPTPSIGHRR